MLFLKSCSTIRNFILSELCFVEPIQTLSLWNIPEKDLNNTPFRNYLNKIFFDPDLLENSIIQRKNIKIGKKQRNEIKFRNFNTDGM